MVAANITEESACIFERYGYRAKVYDCLCSFAARRSLTETERAFVQSFSDMLNGDGSESAMREAFHNWTMDELS